MTFDSKRISIPEPFAADQKIMALWEKGDHGAVIDLYPDYRQHGPEGRFGHYFTMLGAYESQHATGQVQFQLHL